MATRITHTVRCRSKSDPQLYADVVVVDALCLRKPNGGLFILDVEARLASPTIVDTTPDGNYGVDAGKQGSRVSHIERFVSADDSTQIMDVEILDAFSVDTLLSGQGDEGGPSTENDQQNREGEVDHGGDGAPCLRTMLDPDPLVSDETGLNLSTSPSHPTRAGHIDLVTDAGNTDEKTADANAVPPTNRPWLAQIKSDEIGYGGTNGNNYNLSAPPTLADDIDATVYVTDPFTGEDHVPPDNKDPNVYIGFPASSNGGSLGKAPQSQHTGKSGPIMQGPFWWIKKINGPPNPWFWWAPIQTPLAFSFFGSPPVSAFPKWGFRGFQLLNFYPVIWILSENNPLSPMGNFGSASLEDAATDGDWYNLGSIPTAPIWAGGLKAGLTFGPFGYLPVLDPPADPFANGGEFPFSNVVPNVWQLTGITQPNLSNPKKAWDRVKNPYVFPTPSKWETMAQTFQENWNSVANACNAALSALSGEGNIPNDNLLTAPPQGWQWATPYYIPQGPAGHAPQWGSFQNGIMPLEAGLGGIPPEIFTPATVATLNVSQLDPKVWDTRPTFKQDQGQDDKFGPPIRWSDEH